MKYLFITLFIFTIFSTNNISIAGTAKEDGQWDLVEAIFMIQRSLNASYQHEQKRYFKIYQEIKNADKDDKDDLDKYKEWYKNEGFEGKFHTQNIDDLVRWLDSRISPTVNIKNKKNKLYKDNWDIDTLSQYLEDTLRAQDNKLYEEHNKRIIDTKNNNNILKFKMASYLGEFKKNKAHGNGIFIFLDGSIYEGKVSRNKINGKGKYTDSQGNIYEGKFRNGTLKIKIDKNTRDIIKLKPKTGIHTYSEIKGKGVVASKWFQATINNSGIYELTAKGKRDMDMAKGAAESSGGSGGDGC